MSNTVEQRTVEMRFDNSNFEKNIAQSQNSLNAFNKNLGTLGGVSTGIGAFAAQLKGLTFDPINNGIQIGIGKLAALTAALTGISNLASDIYYKTTSLVKSLTFDNITAGFDKYSQKTTSVQTIMAAVRQEGETEEQAMARVNKQLEKLNWFTDETSYNFTDMVNNIGKFTSQGVELERAVTAMQGIATWAAKSGGGVNEASRAMYNLSQAMGVGSVQTIDWKSIENANMGTKEFKEQAIQAAAAMDMLIKKGDKFYTKAGNHEVNFQNFRDTLKYDWFSSDVLMKVLEQYGSYANIVHDMQEDGETAAETMARLKEEGVEAENAIAAAAFKAAQEAKTFREAIDATKDAVSTAFLNIFETLFGNYLEAKELWTDFANGLYDIFAKPIVDFSDLLKKWKEMGGRLTLLKSIKRILESITGVLSKIKEEWQKVFSPININNIKTISNAFETFSNRVKRVADTLLRNETIWKNLSVLFVGIKKVVDLVKNSFKLLFTTILDGVRGSEMQLIEKLSEFLAKIGEVLTKLAEFIEKNKIVERILNGIKIVIGSVVEAYKKLRDAIKEAFGKKDENAIDQIGNSAKEARGPLEVIRDLLKTIIDFVGDLLTNLAPLLGSVFEFVKSIGSVLIQVVEHILPILKSLFEVLSSVFKEVAARLKTFFDTADFTRPFELLGKAFTKVGEVIGAAVSKIAEGIAKAREASAGKKGEKKEKKSFFQKMAEEIGLFADTLMKHKSSIEWVQKTLLGNKDMITILDQLAMNLAKFVLTMFAGVVIITKLISIVSKVKSFTGWIMTLPEVMKEGFSGIAKAIGGGLKSINNTIKQFTAVKLIKAIGESLLMMAGAFFIISLIPADQIGRVAAVVAGSILMICGACTALIVLAGKIDKSSNIVDDVITSKGLFGTSKTEVTSKRLGGSLGTLVSLVVAIGAAVLMMGIAMKAISSIGSWQMMIVAFVGVAALMAAMVGVIAVLHKMDIDDDDARSMTKLSICMLIMGMAMKKVAKALKIIAEGEIDRMLPALGIIVTIFGVFAIIIGIGAYLIRDESVFVGISGMMTSAGIMFLALAAAVTILSRFGNFDKMTAALGVAGTLLLGVIALMAAAASAAKQITTGTQVAALVLLSVIIGEFAVVLIAIAVALRLIMIGTTGDDIVKAAASLTMIVGVIGALLLLSTKAVKNVGDILALVTFAGAVALFGAALLALVPPIKALSQLKLGEAAIAVGVIAAIIGILVGGAAILSKAKKIGQSLLLISIAVVALSVAGFVAAGAIALLAVSFKMFVDTLAALVELGPKAGAAVAGLVAGFAVGVVDLLKNIALGLLEVMKTFVDNKDKIKEYMFMFIQIIFEGLNNAVPVIFDFIRNLLDRIFDLAEEFFPRLNNLITNTVDQALDQILGLLEKYLPRINDLITTTVDQALDQILGLLEKYIPRLNELITNTVDQALGMILGLIETHLPRLNNLITDTVIDVIHDINRVIRELTPDIVDTIVFVTVKITKGVASMTKEITKTVLDLLSSLLTMLLEYLPDISFRATQLGIELAIALLSGILVGTIKGIAENIPKIVGALADAFVDLVNGMCEVIEEKSDDVYDAFVKMIETACKTLGEWIGRITGQGGLIRMISSNIVDGFVKGIKTTENQGKLKGAGVWMAKMINLGTKSKSGLDINSPSKVFMKNGASVVEGLVKGISNKGGDLKAAGTGLAQTLGKAFTNTFGSLGGKVSGLINDLKGDMSGAFDLNGLLDGITDLNPTITPELDLSKITEQAGGIDTLFNNKQITAIGDITNWNTAQANFLSDQNALDAVESKQQMNSFMDMFSDYVDIQKYNANQPTNVNVTLQGDASKMLKILKVEDSKQSKATGLRSLIRN